MKPIKREKHGCVATIMPMADYEFVILEVQKSQKPLLDVAELLFPELEWIEAQSVPYSIGINLLGKRLVSYQTKDKRLLFPIRSFLKS